MGNCLTTVEKRLDKESEAAIEALVASEIQALVSAGCEIDFGTSVLTVWATSIPIGVAQFIVVEVEWSDTPLEAIDYYRLSVRFMPAPKSVEYIPRPGPGGVNYPQQHATLHLGAKVPVQSVDVLEFEDEGELEAVRYDAGLLITRVDGVRIAITREMSITGFLTVSHEQADVERALAGLSLRQAFTRQVR